jgi:hypothetical protein
LAVPPGMVKVTLAECSSASSSSAAGEGDAAVARLAMKACSISSCVSLGPV